jgi:hypothetical protein
MTLVPDGLARRISEDRRSYCCTSPCGRIASIVAFAFTTAILHCHFLFIHTVGILRNN